ncbi:hypothetical protein [Pseudarthrobacter sp. C4D7]|uniref:hypothetical protein n=1 Tax=Pseudarthrobacter sp. C4D7 TaxID=2735268 RepID=UPI0020C822A5|nr:hypothetical protein [Pseudarthrobacter sp. C4D7]
MDNFFAAGTAGALVVGGVVAGGAGGVVGAGAGVTAAPDGVGAGKGAAWDSTVMELGEGVGVGPESTA